MQAMPTTATSSGAGASGSGRRPAEEFVGPAGEEVRGGVGDQPVEGADGGGGRAQHHRITSHEHANL
jgi:hypothetical protein